MSPGRPVEQQENAREKTAADDRASTERLPALDGMRGVAAFVVLIHHLSLVARPYLDTGQVGDAWWWLDQTPFKLASAGTEAVLLFFVLSGLVVALPAVRSLFSWRQYYISRLLRLYLPVWAALAFAALLIALIPRQSWAVTNGTWITDANATSVTVPQLMSEASLWRVSYDIDNVLWSLRWELVFSLTLPLFVALALLLRRLWLPAAVIACALTVIGRVAGVDALLFLPVFFLGTLMAVHLRRLRRWAAGRSGIFWVAIIVAALLLLILSYLLRFAVPTETRGNALLWGLAGVGAAGLILAALGSPRLAKALSRPIPQWLGRISFSLYLVHVPVIASLAFLLGDARWPLVVGLGVPLCLAIGWLFFRVAERPAHRLAKRAGLFFVPRPTNSQAKDHAALPFR